MSVLWIGETPYWPRKPESKFPVAVMPLTEDEVLNVALANGEMSPLRHLSIHAAINCTSRLAQRVALSSTGLNPRWFPVQWCNGVMKAPASASSHGVWVIEENRFVDKLRAVAPDLANIGVLEERIWGERYEQDGFIVNGQVYFFYSLLQHWNQANDFIENYERVSPPGLQEIACMAVHAVGLNDCAFCVEVVKTKDRWFVIEVNARLGYDNGLAELLCDDYPLDRINKAFT